MVGPQHRHQRFAEQLHPMHRIRQRQRADHAHLQAFLEQRLEYLAAAHFLQVEVYVRIGLAEGMDAAGYGRGEGCRGSETDLQLAQFPQVGPTRQQHRLVYLGQHLAGLVEEQPAGVGEFDAAVGALEQARTDFLLQRLDLLAQRRLGDREGRLADVATLGGAAEVQLLGDGDEIAQVPEFQAAPPIRSFYISIVSINILEII